MCYFIVCFKLGVTYEFPRKTTIEGVLQRAFTLPEISGDILFETDFSTSLKSDVFKKKQIRMNRPKFVEAFDNFLEYLKKKLLESNCGGLF